MKGVVGCFIIEPSPHTPKPQDLKYLSRPFCLKNDFLENLSKQIFIFLNGDQSQDKYLTTDDDSKIIFYFPHPESTTNRVVDFDVNKTGDSVGKIIGFESV